LETISPYPWLDKIITWFKQAVRHSYRPFGGILRETLLGFKKKYGFCYKFWAIGENRNHLAFVVLEISQKKCGGIAEIVISFWFLCSSFLVNCST
jgi:hypothetical protein